MGRLGMRHRTERAGNPLLRRLGWPEMSVAFFPHPRSPGSRITPARYTSAAQTAITAVGHARVEAARRLRP
jgi:hypothetical protein